MSLFSSTPSVSARPLLSLSRGETGYIVGFSNMDLRMRCHEMGLSPGQRICLCRKHPFGRWLHVETNEGHFLLRCAEAEQIQIAPVAPV